MADSDDAKPESGGGDIRSALAEAFASQEVANSPVSEAPEPAPAPKVDPAPVEPAEGRQRGPDGKFKPAEAKEALEPAEKPAARDPKATPEPKETPAAQGAAKEAPDNWSPADKAAFKTLPAPAQDFLLRRHGAMEADYTRKTQAIAEFQREYEPVRQLFAPHADILKAKGFTPSSLVQAWYQVEKNLMEPTQAVQTAANIIKGYNIPLDKVAAALGLHVGPKDGQPPAPTAEQPIALPPEVTERLTAVDRFLADQQRREQLGQQQQFEQRAQGVMNDINQFASATDSAGALLHPHFQEVEADMQRLVLASRASGQAIPPLSELYDQAVWANPSTRKQVLDAERAADQAQRDTVAAQKQAEARERAERARRAGASVNGSPGGAGGQAPSRRGSNGSVRDDLMAAVDEVDS